MKKILGAVWPLAQPIQPISTQIRLNWLCYLAGNSQTAPTIFFQIFRIWFFKDFIRNPQTTIALTFLTHIISGVDGVYHIIFIKILYYVLYYGTFGWCKVVRKHYAYLLNKLSAQTFGAKNFDETAPWTLAQKQLFRKRSCFYKLIKLVNSFLALIKAEDLNCKWHRIWILMHSHVFPWFF